MALPNWLDQVPNLSFEREKTLLTQIAAWAEALHWHQTPVAEMAFSEQQKTDMLLASDDFRKLRIAVLPKNRDSQGAIRIQAIPTITEAEYRWKTRKRKWEVEVGGVPMDRYNDEPTFKWLIGRLFAK